MAIELPALPYADDALAPHISERTICFHYGKHHAAYVNNLNGLIEGTDHADASLEDIVAAPRPGRPVQQRGPGLEPHLLLELHDARRRRRPHR